MLSCKNICMLTLLLLLSACSTSKVEPQKSSVDSQQESLTKEIKQTRQDGKYTLEVVTQKGARVRILNIKPKYFDGIELDEGPYLIEVKKSGYKTYKEWIDLKKDRVLHVKLKKIVNPYDVSYFKYVSKIYWYNTNELFTPVYDAKNNLIWALQKPYVLFVKHRSRLKMLSKTLYVAGLPWPKIKAAKLDTLTYTGYYRYKGRNFLLKNKNTLMLYKASQDIKEGYNIAKLESLAVNGRIESWRLPKEEEILQENPFKIYQKHFEIEYKRHKDLRLNLPVLYTRLKKSSFYSSGSLAYAYNPKSGLYDGKVLHSSSTQEQEENINFVLNHGKNFALVLPVREKRGFYDTIIFDKRLDAFEKFKALSSALIKKSVKSTKADPKKVANKMASKAMKMLFGDPYIVGTKLYGSSGDFTYYLTKAAKKKNPKYVLLTLKDDTFVLKELK